ncbi:MAG: rod-determining factor RdfA [Halobacteriales archaeon]
MATGTPDDCSCKVGRVVERRGLAGLDDELRRHRANGASLRTLADLVNRRVLAAALEGAADGVPMDDLFGAVSDDRAVELVYEALADDDAGAERRARVRTRLSQRGVDVDAVTDDWVTHPTVRRHLRECLGVDTGRDGSITGDDALDTIEWSRSRAEGVVGRTFERLDDAGLVQTGDLDVSATFQLTCTACGHTYRPRQLLEEGGCACHGPDDPQEPSATR